MFWKSQHLGKREKKKNKNVRRIGKNRAGDSGSVARRQEDQDHKMEKKNQRVNDWLRKVTDIHPNARVKSCMPQRTYDSGSQEWTVWENVQERSNAKSEDCSVTSHDPWVATQRTDEHGDSCIKFVCFLFPLAQFKQSHNLMYLDSNNLGLQ